MITSATYKVKGAAMVYAMLIFFVAALIITNVSLMESFHQKSQIDLGRKHQVMRNVDSAMALMLGDDFDFDPDDSGWQTIDIFSEERDSVKLKKMPWGVLTVITCEAWNKKYNEQKGALLGYHHTIKYALNLAEMNQALSVTGNTKISGPVKLPKKGVKRAYIEGENYTGDKMIYGRTENSDRELKGFDKERFTDLFDQDFFGETDSIIETDAVFSERIQQSFFQPTVVLESYGDLDLLDAHLSGNCKIFCDGDLFISAETKLTQTVIFARQVFIESGFKGDLQLFASDSVFIEDNVQLTYPTMIYAYCDKKDDQSAYIFIDSNTHISGEVMVYNKHLTRNNWPRIIIENEAIIQGQVFSNGFVNLTGSVAGNISTLKFFHKGLSGSYENTLVNARISMQALSPNFMGSQIMSKKSEKHIITSLK